jgi:sulfatase modifying factor 1
MRALSWLVGSAAILGSTTACQLIGGFESFDQNGTGGGGTAGSAAAGAGGSSGMGGSSSGGTGGSSGSGGGAPAKCRKGSDPGLHGPRMAEWQRPDGSCFWIDSTEVTVGQYKEFVAAPAHAPESSVCNWNEPGSSDGTGGHRGFEPTCPTGPADTGAARDADPVACVDWCDAEAFCSWAGKSLCVDTTVQTDWTKWQASDWYAVCSSNGANTYPYGRTQSADACATVASPNGCPGGSCSAAEAGSYTSCAVPAQGNAMVFDLVGNVEEWTAACSPNTASGACNTRGGFYGSQGSCGGSVNRVSRQDTSSTVGFRCCATAGDATDGG